MAKILSNSDVDDDEDVLIELERLLEGEGYQHGNRGSGQEALALSKSCSLICSWWYEHLANVDAHALFDELVARQPNAFRFLMHTRKESTDLTAQTAVCKWEHADVMAKIRNCLAA